MLMLMADVCGRYLGLYKEEVEAAIAYDREAVKCQGILAVTNFDLAEYVDLLGMPPSLLLVPFWRCVCQVVVVCLFAHQTHQTATPKSPQHGCYPASQTRAQIVGKGQIVIIYVVYYNVP